MYMSSILNGEVQLNVLSISMIIMIQVTTSHQYLATYMQMLIAFSCFKVKSTMLLLLHVCSSINPRHYIHINHSHASVPGLSSSAYIY